MVGFPYILVASHAQTLDLLDLPLLILTTHLGVEGSILTVLGVCSCVGVGGERADRGEEAGGSSTASQVQSKLARSNKTSSMYSRIKSFGCHVESLNGALLGGCRVGVGPERREGRAHRNPDSLWRLDHASYGTNQTILDAETDILLLITSISAIQTGISGLIAQYPLSRDL